MSTTRATHQRRMRTRLAVSALAALAVGLGPLMVAGHARAAQQSVDGVQLRWGINAESNKRSPIGYNLLSAGRLGNPGRGSQQLKDADNGATWANGKPAGWKATAGNVRIEKLQANDSYRLASWEGLRTDKNGAALTSATNSGHQVVIDQGTGSLDAAADDATITWDGDFTVAFYTGMIFFYVSDPKLVVDDGEGRLTATLSGFGSDIDDPTKWVTVAPAEVTLATLPSVDVSATGLITTPAYSGVGYDAPSGGVEQVRTGPYWGSFPKSFVDFQQTTGLGAYWYSSGGAADPYKPALPITVDTDPAVQPAPAAKLAASNRVYGKASKATLTLARPTGSTAAVTGKVTLTWPGVKQTLPLSGGKATFTLPKTLKPGSYPLKVAYPGNANYDGVEVAKLVTITKAGVAKPTWKVTTKPTPKKKGKATVTVKSKVNGAPATGKLTITLAKGSAKKQVTANLKNGKATVSLPKLAKGTWKVTLKYPGTATHQAANSKPADLKVAG